MNLDVEDIFLVSAVAYQVVSDPTIKMTKKDRKRLAEATHSMALLCGWLKTICGDKKALAINKSESKRVGPHIKEATAWLKEFDKSGKGGNKHGKKTTKR